MVVYVAQAGKAGPVKIGYTASPVMRRMANLQLAQAVKVALIRLFDGTREHEKQLHERFADHRLKGEWFKPVPEIIEGDFGLPALPLPDRVRRPANGSRLGAYMYANGLTQVQFAAMVGVKHCTISRWLSGETYPKRSQLEAVLSATGGEVTPNDLLPQMGPYHSAQFTAPHQK